jgi:hypothetical protein
MLKERVIQMKKAVEKKATKAVEKKATKAVEKKATKAVVDENVAEKKVSNTQRCADMIIMLARDAKHTRQEIVATVADALSALSVVTVKTMMSDLQNSKYARRYSTHTISVDKATKIVSIAGEIV